MKTATDTTNLQIFTANVQPFATNDEVFTVNLLTFSVSLRKPLKRDRAKVPKLGRKTARKSSP
ncbi:hypothetical protein NIES2104_39330 [Leptolyngbya sp. NIES-2104]|nr:hypothetical protein NIES2104_39330 [Leptolyngbya sp. NIES-2104]